MQQIHVFSAEAEKVWSPPSHCCLDFLIDIYYMIKSGHLLLNGTFPHFRSALICISYPVFCLKPLIFKTGFVSLASYII